MKRILFYIVLIITAWLCKSCENYIDSGEMAGLFTSNDLSVKLKILDNDSHKYELKKVADTELASGYCLDLNVKNKFSISSGEIPITLGKKYKLSFKFKNFSASPIVQYSFWENSKNPLRTFVLAGENGNPPSAKTREVYTEWKNFEEIFEAKEKEVFLVIRIFSDEGNFSIGEIAIKEIKN